MGLTDFPRHSSSTLFEKLVNKLYKQIKESEKPVRLGLSSKAERFTV